jgi:hypothetical protein
LITRKAYKMAHEREAGVDRIIAFSDGVVAIAITLLILPLTEIDRAQDATLGNVVVDNQSALFAFALSFAVIATIGRFTTPSCDRSCVTTHASCSSTCCGLP